MRKLKILCLWVVEYEGKLTFEQYNVFPALNSLGYEVKFYMMERFDEVSLADTIQSFKPDYILFKPYANIIRPEFAAHIYHNMNYKIICWNGDDDKYINFSKRFSNNVYCIATNLKSALETYKKLGQKAVYFPYAANNTIFKKKNCKKVFDCSFIGAIRPTRVYYFDKLANAGLNILVKGAGWKTEDSVIPDIDEYVNIINKTKVNLNVSEDILKGNKLINQVKGRDFEVPMAGGFLLTKDSDQIREFYKPGKEIEVYKDADEFIDKAKYYVKNDSKRERIALSGYKRALKCHTYKIRLTNLFKEIS